MIIRNGKITLYGKDRGRYYDGEPDYDSPPRKIEVPAQIVPLERDALALSSATGRPIDYAKYMILVEAKDYKKINPLGYEVSRAFIVFNEIQCKVKVISVEYLRAVSQYKLTVIQRIHR